MSKTLLVLAAGIGSRYGGFKQMEPVGPTGEFILDYSVFDARRAGFDKVVFVIREEIKDDFKAVIGARIAPHMEVAYACQRITDLPDGFATPSGRNKPWGTGHATLTAAPLIDEPFAVINADDFYGAESFSALAAFLDQTADEPARYAMVGYQLDKTLSNHGHVARGLCTVDSDSNLAGIVELTHIVKTPDGARCNSRKLTGNEVVSMNLWGFKPCFLKHLRREFKTFLETSGSDPKAEFFVPTVVNTLITGGEATCAVLHTPSQWTGVTYPEEKDDVMRVVRDLIARDIYPESLWG